MSDRMTCMPFAQLLEWVFGEYENRKTIFGQHRFYKAADRKTLEIFGRKLETPLGPAAGPHTQLSQNIIASYLTGSRFFEVKTVQIIDGEDLPVSKPCINAHDEGYNVEWSTELTVPNATHEYINAWVMLHLLAIELELGAADGFQFNMSVGYDLAGIKSEKINTYIDTMMDASSSDAFKTAIEAAIAFLPKFKKVTEADIRAIPAKICNSATLSTLHGCPPQEIERIATYLIEEKGLHTFIKCNPTLLGYDFARATLNKMGYDYIAFGTHHFEHDLQWADAIPMLKRLKALCESKKLQFGVKITNTFPVDIKAGELPGNEMYMSGRSLFALSISLAAKLSTEFDGTLRISYSGGVDRFNIEKIVGCGIWPVTIATTMLKPGGYARSIQLADLSLSAVKTPFTKIDVSALNELAESAPNDKNYRKSIKMPPARKNGKKVPLIDCYVAGCQEGCPIHQDIPTYIRLNSEGKYAESLNVIMDRNALPFMTGTICAHPCQSGCVRNLYESSVQIRQTKLDSAEHAYKEVLANLKPTGKSDKRVAVVGGGPGGIAAAFYLARAGVAVTLYEKTDALGGIVHHVIPDFRIDAETIRKDVAFIEKLGVKIVTGREISDVAALRAEGFDAVVLAVGASKLSNIKIDGIEVWNAIEFLDEFNKKEAKVDLGKKVVVIGGGNTAMDTARAAKRTRGVDDVTLVYRRTMRYMPADSVEIRYALEDGVIIRELLAPVKWENGELLCKQMELGKYDESGRRSFVDTGKTVTIPCDSIIAAIGEKVPTDFYKANGIAVNEKGVPTFNKNSYETSVEGVYLCGDGRMGPATIVEAEADAIVVANAILDVRERKFRPLPDNPTSLYAKRGILNHPEKAAHEQTRCLSCSTICEICTEVCPNRANVAVTVPGIDMPQIIHIDYMCNECGNCETFCPWTSAPYKDKLTLFATEADFEDSDNNGFLVLDRDALRYKVRLLGRVFESDGNAPTTELPSDVRDTFNAVVREYGWMIP